MKLLLIIMFSKGVLKDPSLSFSKQPTLVPKINPYCLFPANFCYTKDDQIISATDGIRLDWSKSVGLLFER